MMQNGRRNTTVSQSITMQNSWPISSPLDLMLDNNPNMYIFPVCSGNIIRAA